MNKGLSAALQTFHFAARHVPAYKKILQQHKVRAGSVHDKSTFEKLPILDKNSFIKKFPLTKLLPKGDLPKVGYASSGSSGNPTYWFRSKAQETYATNVHEAMVRDMFGIKKSDRTLVIICFSMGVWVAGNSESAAFRALAERGYNITIITPGIEKNDILGILKSLAPTFTHVIMAGYPPFISDILHACAEEHIALGKKFRILTAGDSFTESWRDMVINLLGLSVPSHVLNIYGSADGGLLGFETPLSIFLRRQAAANPKLFTDLFGNALTEPAFLQYSPEHVYFETFGSELMFTINAGIPLIRYNIHDIGQIHTYTAMKEILTRQGLLARAKTHDNPTYQLPFVVKYGRTDVAVTFYALNIYPENLLSAVQDKQIARSFSGSFFSYNQDSKNHTTHKLHVALELAPKKIPGRKIEQQAKKVFTRHLLAENIEYRKLYHTIGSKAEPIIHLKKFGHLGPKTGLYFQTGKKPKLLP